MVMSVGGRASPPRASDSSGGQKQTVLIIIGVVLILLAGALLFKHTVGDTEGANSRAQKYSTPQAIGEQYKNTDMPPQARAAAEAAARAHGAPIGQQGR